MSYSTLLATIASLALLGASSQWASGDEKPAMERGADTFDRSYMVFDNGQFASTEVIRTAVSSAKADRPSLFGWCEYDLQVPETGWYELLVSPAAWRYEFTIDGGDYRFCQVQGSKAGNFYLTSGRHTLRMQRIIYWFGPFGPIEKLTLRPAGAELSSRVNVRVASKFTVQRKGEPLELEVTSGGLTSEKELVIRVQESGGKELLRQAVKLPAGQPLVSRKVSIPSDRAGLFELHVGEKDKPADDQNIQPIEFSVVDTTPVAHTGEAIKKTLVKEIDCATTSPDYSNGDASRVVHSPMGDYRESGRIGWYGHMNAAQPCWFAYSVKIPHPQRQYVVEVDYPDDALRTFCIVLREAVAGTYPTAGGVDSGGEFSLSYKMQTHSLLHWAQSTDLRVMMITATDGMRAAAARIRVYEVEGELAPLDVPSKGGRSFGNWFEEGSSFLGVFGGPDYFKASMKDYLLTADRWVRAIAYIGGDTLWPTFAVYQFGLYPSNYNVLFTGPHTLDVARVVLLNCEKYGVGMIAEFHPEAREVSWGTADGKQNDNLLISKDGLFGPRPGSGGTQPFFNPLHPRNQEWYLGMVGEFADRYKESPAFRGVSLRLMTWVNPSLNNLHSLDWGYEDFTIALFEQETGTKIPVDAKDPGRYALRYAWLMANAKEKWIA